MPFWIKVMLSAVVISASSSIAGRRPDLAGWLLALPLSSMLALAFAQLEFEDASRSAAFARSILAAVPLSLTFFVPFVFAERLRLSFWWLYALGVALLSAAFFAHQWWTRH
jgi:hypothetical protein